MTTTTKLQAFEGMLQQALNARMHQVSRRRLVRNAAIAGGAVAAAGSIRLGAAQDSTPSDMMMGESPFETAVDVLNYALTLEHLESAFYRDGLAAIGEGGITGLGFDASVFEKLTMIGEHEAEHVTTLTAVITDADATELRNARRAVNEGEDVEIHPLIRTR